MNCIATVEMDICQTERRTTDFNVQSKCLAKTSTCFAGILIDVSKPTRNIFFHAHNVLQKPIVFQTCVYSYFGISRLYVQINLELTILHISCTEAFMTIKINN